MLSTPMVSGERAVGEDAGVVRGQILYEGPPVKELAVTGSLADGTGEQGIKWVAVYLTRDVARPDSPHKERAVPTVKYANRRFTPYVTLLPPKTICELVNADKQSVMLSILGYDFHLAEIVQPQRELRIELSPKEKWPIQVLDFVNVIDGWIVPVPSPYCAVSGADGRFAIQSLPAGTHKLRFWHPQIRFGKVLKRSELAVEVHADKDVTLAPIKVLQEHVIKPK